MTKVQTSCIQMRSSQDLSENIAEASYWIENAASQGAQLVQTPEMTSLLVKRKSELMSKVSPPDQDPAIHAFCELAGRLNIWLNIGSVPVLLDNGRVANRQLIICPEGKVFAFYDKIHMFDVELGNGESYQESNSYNPGDHAVLAKTSVGRIGMSICYDVRFPGLYRVLAQAGAEILTIPAAFTQVTGEAHWETLIRARAIETGSFVLAAAQGGQHADGRATFGHSMIIDPWGQVLAHADHDTPGIISAELNTADVSKARARIPSLRHGKDFRLQLVTSDSGAQ